MSDPFSPVQLGPITLRNRIIKAATSEGRSPDGLVTDDLIAFHRSFAEGGVGMTTVAYCCVSPEGASAPGQIVMSRQALPGLRRLTDTVHRAGAAISAQLGHAGVVAPKALTGVTPVAPSRFINPSSLSYCRAITRQLRLPRCRSTPDHLSGRPAKPVSLSGAVEPAPGMPAVGPRVRGRASASS